MPAPSVFSDTSSVLIDFSTRESWSANGSLPDVSQFSRPNPGLLATLARVPDEDTDFSFCFHLTSQILSHFLKQNLGIHSSPKLDLSLPSPSPLTDSSYKKSTNLKKLRCGRCQFACVNSAQLAGHMRKHTGERPFTCSDESCGKKFARKEELTRHARIHSGHRPYQCCICDKRFGRKDHLNKHMNVHITRYADPIFQRAVCRFFAQMNSPQ